MKALYIIIGLWFMLTGLCALAGIVEIDRITYGLYITGLGVIVATVGFDS